MSTIPPPSEADLKRNAEADWRFEGLSSHWRAWLKRAVAAEQRAEAAERERDELRVTGTCYDKAMAASNELGYACSDAESVIRDQGQRIAELEAANEILRLTLEQRNNELLRNFKT